MDNQYVTCNYMCVIYPFATFPRKIYFEDFPISLFPISFDRLTIKNTVIVVSMKQFLL